MKKTTKTTKSKALTPAKKTASAVKKKTTATPAVKKTTPKAKAVALAPSALVTTISALIDVGFGNTLYVRGEGPGLSWEKGLPMNCVADTEWIITLNDAVDPFTFKFLLNDETWCTGADFNLAPGKTGAFTPEF